MDKFTVEAIKANLIWAMDELRKEGYIKGKWNLKHTIFAEHWTRAITAGGTVYLCRDGGFNVDYDNRCECCGSIFEMGSIDFTDELVDETAQKIHERLNRAARRCRCM